MRSCTEPDKRLIRIHSDADWAGDVDDLFIHWYDDHSKEKLDTMEVNKVEVHSLEHGSRIRRPDDRSP